MEELEARDVVGDEWAEWFALSPLERWKQTDILWQIFLDSGGSLDPEPDPQSPFFDEEEWRENLTHGRSSVRLLRRGGI